MKTKIFSYGVLLIAALTTNLAVAFREADQPDLPDFDKRIPAQAPVLDAVREAGANALRARIPSVRIDLKRVGHTFLHFQFFPHFNQTINVRVGPTIDNIAKHDAHPLSRLSIADPTAPKATTWPRKTKQKSGS